MGALRPGFAAGAGFALRARGVGEAEFGQHLLELVQQRSDLLVGLGRERAEGLGRTPIHVVSANAMTEHVEASREAGADGHIAKPISAEVLFATLEGVAEQGAQAAAAA